MTTTCNHPIGSVACVLDEGHEGGHQGIEETTGVPEIPTGVEAAMIILESRLRELERWRPELKPENDKDIIKARAYVDSDATLKRAQTAEAALAFTEKDWLVVRDQRDAAEAALAEAKAALESCWGQNLTDDRLHFVIAVKGLPASTRTPEWVAEQVVEAINGEASLVAWRMGLPTDVRLTFTIDDSSRAAIARIDQHPTQEAEVDHE